MMNELHEKISTLVYIGFSWIFVLLLVLFTISCVILAKAMVSGDLLLCLGV